MTGKAIKRRLLNQQTQEIAILVGLFAFSLAVRRIGVKHGFPLLTHPDEEAILLPVYEMTRNRTLNPGSFMRPNQILYLLNFLHLNGLSYLRFNQNLGITYPGNVLTFHYYARMLISALGSLIPLIAYKIGKLFKPNFALPAGLVFAVFPLYAIESLYITPDIPITLFTLVIILFTLLYLKQGSEKWLYLAVFFSAVNTAEKYPGLISLSIVFLGVLLKYIETPGFTWRTHWSGLVKKGLLIIGLFVIALFMVAPYLFIEFDMVTEAIRNEARTTHLGADNLGWGGNLWYYVQTFVEWSNILSILWISLGIFALVKWRDKHALVLIYGALYWIILSRLALHWPRWSLPMYITPLFLIAIGITQFWQWIKTRPQTRPVAILILLFLAQQFIATVHISVAMSFTDTLVTSSIYCDENGVRPENSLYEGYTPLLPNKIKILEPQDLVTAQDIDFIVLSSEIYDRYEAEPERYVEKLAFYQSIRQNHLLIAEFTPTPAAQNTFERLDDILFYAQKRLKLTTEERYKGQTIQIFEFTP